MIRRARRRATALAWIASPGLIAGLLLSLLPVSASAGFGLPESRGLLTLRTEETTGLGALGSHLGQSYYYQDVGLDSRYHWYTSRLGLTFGLGETGHLFYDQRLHGLLRFAGPADLELRDLIGDSDWTGGLGDADVGMKLVMPLPGDRIHLAGEGVLRLPVGDELRRLTSGGRDYEVVGILSIDLFRGGVFLPVRLHLNGGLRVNRGRDGQGLAPDTSSNGWRGVYPPFYPALADHEHVNTLRQSLYGAGLEFVGRNMRLFGELGVAVLQNIDESEMTLREQPWRLGLGFRAEGFGGEFFGGFDMDLARDDFDTEFAPHYPGLVSTIGYRRDWQVLAGDPDGDGIRGDADGCPDRPEDLDGFEDGDGCPDPDNDRDGVPDLVDLAPNLPEDFDGFEDEDGRPDLDNDNDGIVDSQDLCPDRAEDFDGFEDHDGCPDRGSEQRPAEPTEPAAQPGSVGEDTDAEPANEEEAAP